MRYREATRRVRGLDSRYGIGGTYPRGQPPALAEATFAHRMPSTPRILFVVDRPELNGGNKQISLFAEALAREGYAAAVAAHGPRPGWMDFDGAYYDAETRELEQAGHFDLAIFTYVFSYRLRPRIACARMAHFCQGFEGFAPHLAEQAGEIEDFYRAIPDTICVTEKLADLCRTRFGKRCAVLPPIVEDRFAPMDRAPPGAVKRVLVPGIYEMYTKGVRQALDALALDASRTPVEVVRLSTFPQSDEERVRYAPTRFLCGESPAGVAEAMRDMDLTVTLPTGEEGFGLPALESLASGIPVVCSATDAYRDLLASGAARTAEPATVENYADLIDRVLRTPSLWHEMRLRGIEIAATYRLSSCRVQIAATVGAMLAAAPEPPASDRRDVPRKRKFNLFGRRHSN